MSTRTLPPADPAPSVRAAADRLAREASDRAAEIEAAGTLPLDLVARLRDEGLFRLLLPRALGGLEVDLATIVDVFETLAHGDGAVGWTTMINNSTFFFAYLDPAVARDLIGDGDIIASGAFGPTGRARRIEGGGYTVDGDWSFCSGVSHAGWHVQGVLIADGDTVVLRPDGQPDWRFAYLPHAPIEGEVSVVEHWDVLGLRGTGSHDLAVRGVPVAGEHVVMPFTSRAPHDGPAWRFSFMGILGSMMLGFPLGVARRALDEIVALASGYHRAGSPKPLAEDQFVARRIGRLDARLQATRAFADDALGSAWAVACRGDDPTPDDLARIDLAMIEAVEVAVEVVDAAFALGASAALRDGSVLQRCFRDIHTAAAHIAFSPARWDDRGRRLLGRT